MPKLKPYYENAAVTLYHGDCLELMPEIGGVFDAVISDPPYGIGEHKWDTPIDWPRFFAAANPLCKRNAAKVLFCNMRSACRMIEANSKEYRYDLVVDKGRNSSPADANRKPLRVHENILVFYSKLPTYNPQMWESIPYTMSKAACAAKHRFTSLGEHAPTKNRTKRYPRSIFHISFSPDSKGFGGYEHGYHPTAKPVSLMEYLIKTYTNECDTVLDPFAGGGSTGIAAMRTGRKAVLIELEERFCELAAKRLEAELTTNN